LIREQDDITLITKGRDTDECVGVARKTDTREFETAKDRSLRRGLNVLAKSSLDSDSIARGDVVENLVMAGTTDSSATIKNAGWLS
jgi:hypothetical protein